MANDGTTAASPTPVPAPPGSPRALGLLPHQLEEIVGIWDAQGETVSGLSFAGVEGVEGPGSETMAAMRSVAEPAGRATDSIGTRLADLAVLLRSFKSQAQETDSRTSRAILDLPER